MTTETTRSFAGPDRPRTVAVVQARLGSVRFPRKVLAMVGAQPALRMLLSRLSRSQSLDAIVVALPESEIDNELAELVTGWGYEIVRGSEDDVLARYYEAARAASARLVVRITGDCPFIDPNVVDDVVALALATGAEYTRTSEEFPDGFDVEVAPIHLLKEAYEEATARHDREHVMPWVIRRAAKSAELPCPVNLQAERVVLDEPADLTVLCAVAERLDPDTFTFSDVAALMQTEPNLFEANRHLARNAGASMSTGEKLWRHAQEVIPGGNMLLSKRAEQFLPRGWPAYFSRAKGCEVWDLDGRHYFDLSLMGVGTNILGYGHPRVDEAVRKVIDQGNLSTLNCPEEVALADRLCELHPWADMAKFARSGGEACAIAVRIARAASSKPAVAICGYHGWHDWYLSANLADDAALDGHLLPGLEPNGVPRELQGLTRPFLYNDLEALRTILEAGDVGAVMMEVERSSPPAPGFLEGVRELTKHHGCVLIFDECTSGFRQNLGGLHMLHGVHPDLATFGKTLGNGYAITAVIGRRDVMSSADSTFISSTFWTERIGPTAALAAIQAMQDEDAPRRVNSIGYQIQQIWQDAFRSTGLTVHSTGLPALSNFVIEGCHQPTTKRAVLTSMLARGFLAGPAVYASIAHDTPVLTRYREALAASAPTIADECLRTQTDDHNQSQDSESFGRLA